MPANHTNNPALNNLISEEYVPPEIPDEITEDHESRNPDNPDKANQDLKQKRMKQDFAIQAKISGGKVRGDGSKGSSFSKSSRNESEGGDTTALLPKIEGEEELETSTPSRSVPERGSTGDSRASQNIYSKGSRPRGEPPGVSARNQLDYSGPADKGENLEDQRHVEPAAGIAALSKSGQNGPGSLSKSGQKTPALDADGKPIPTEEELAEMERKRKEHLAEEVNDLYNRLQQ